MPCRNCGSPSTIRAHLIPRVFAREVQSGASHAANVLKSGEFIATQSGIFDTGILCHPCDASIGQLEEYVAEALASVRTIGAANSSPVAYAPELEPEKLLRFCAAVLWKYSVTKPQFGRISLGPYQDITRDVGLRRLPIPPSFDAAMLRLKRTPNDDGVFAYRAPKPDRQGSVNLIRLLVGGVLFLIRLDQRELSDPRLQPLWLRESPTTAFGIATAQAFEEFRIAAKLTNADGRLSNFLERQETLNRIPSRTRPNER